MPLRSQEQEQEQEQEQNPSDFSNEKSPGGGPFEKPSRPPKTPQKKRSKHFAQHVGELAESIKASCVDLESIFSDNGKRFNPYQWVQSKLKEQAHPQAIDDSLSGLLTMTKGDTIKDPWGYADAILKTKNQNINEFKAIGEHELTKKENDEVSQMICEAIGLRF
ncbi:MAG: hypothetical protein ACLFUL_13200 [Desulfobacteraceae bacterium]